MKRRLHRRAVIRNVPDSAGANVVSGNEAGDGISARRVIV
jgi:hypothetical protein